MDLWPLRNLIFAIGRGWSLWILFSCNNSDFLFWALLINAMVSWIACFGRLLWSGWRDHDRSMLLQRAWELQVVFVCVWWRTLFVARKCLLASGTAKLGMPWTCCSWWSLWLPAGFWSCRRYRSPRLWWIYFLDYDWLCPILVPYGLFVLLVLLRLLL